MNISEICKKLNLSQDTLRYYEKISLVPKIARNNGGFREYSDIDCQRIAFVRWMRDAGMSIELLTQYIAMACDGGAIKIRKNILCELRDRLARRIGEEQETLRFLDEKIKGYETHGALEEEKLFCSNNSHLCD